MPDNHTGLTAAEAQGKFKTFGPNVIFKPEKVSFLGIFKHEVTEPMIVFLIFVGVIYSFWGKIEDALTIFTVIVLLVLAEVFNEYRAKKAIVALTQISAPRAKTLRDGAVIEVDATEVVPDDIIVLSAGTKVSADARLVEGIDVQIDESALTGESYPQDKKINDMIYAGTVVAAGEGLALVKITGPKTRIGTIVKSTAAVKTPRTPLQLAMKKLSKQLVWVAIFFSVLIPLLGWLRGQDLRTAVLTGLSLAFATIPEELPIIITMVLGLGAYKLSKNNFLIKHIKAAETLGNATVIVTDKTGTITSGTFTLKDVFPAAPGIDVLECAQLATTPFSVQQLDKIIRSSSTKASPKSSIVHQRNFTNESKSNALIRREENGKLILYVKGAPEIVFASCIKVNQNLKDEVERQASLGHRLIAVARRVITEKDLSVSWENLEKEMQVCGLISFEDAPREGVRETILQASRAGIRTIMVTGDHPETARSIARQVDILDGGEEMIGEELDKLSDEKLRELVKKTSVFARTTPEHKYRIVQSLQANGEVVAVTGDGVNDALALKGADIGIAMGRKGTDVAKEAAEVVLADDNFITITQGVFEGRKFYDNLKKGIKYYISIKIALIMIFLLPVLLGIPMPFAPIQIIVLELFMDLAASAGFVSEPSERNIYSRPSRPVNEAILDSHAITDVLLKAFVLFIAVISVYLAARSLNFSLMQTQTLAFTAWIFGHIALAYTSRSDRELLLRMGMFGNLIINIWAISAIAFLSLGVFWSSLSGRLNLTPVSLYPFLLAAFVAIIIPSLLEIKKMFGAHD